MAAAANNRPPSTGSSSSSGILTPPSSDASDTASHASAAGTNNSISLEQPWLPSHQVLTYLAQAPVDDASMYGRLLDQPQEGDPDGRIAFYTARAGRNLDQVNAMFGSTRS